MKAHPSIDPRLFTMIGKKLYSTHPLKIVVRELLQNSRDACIRKGVEPEIVITIDHTEKSTWVTCKDNGIGMTQEQLVNEFLCLGNTSKMHDTNAVGGFGIASAALMRNPEWSVRSLDTYVDNTYFFTDEDMPTLPDVLDGTEVKVHIVEETYMWHLRETIAMVRMSQTKARLIVNGEYSSDLYDAGGEIPLHPEITKDTFILSSVLGDLAEDGYVSERLFVALHGLVQFSLSFYGLPFPLVLDLKPAVRPDDASYPLNMSREQLENELYDEVSTIIKDNYIEKPETAKVEREFAIQEVKDKITEGEMLRGRRGLVEHLQEAGKGYFEAYEEARSFRPETAKKREPCMMFTNYSAEGRDLKRDARLMKLWQEILKEVCTADEEFGIGFICHPDVAAVRAYDANTQKYFYQINPDIWLADEVSTVYYVHMLACHEQAHKHEENHNEKFAIAHAGIFRETIPVISRGISYYTHIARQQ